MNSEYMKQYLTHPALAFAKACGKLMRGSIEQDASYLKILFRQSVGYPLDLENPRTFNEKLQWLKLHDRNPLYTKLVDKAEGKPWVAERIGWEHVVPTLGVWDSFDDIDFGALPERFVLKCTHDSGGLAICRDRATFDMGAARRKIERSLSRNFYWSGREWPYKDVRPRVLAEEYLDVGASIDPADYKFFCFDGEPKALFIATGRSSGDTRFDFFDADFNHLPIENGHPNARIMPERPKSYGEMLEMARVLSVGIPHVRVDFYDVYGKPFFGEMTFFHWSGLVPFTPKEYDYYFGSWLKLPNEVDAK